MGKSRAQTLRRGDHVLIPSQHLSGTVFETHPADVEVSVVSDGVAQRRHFTYESVERILTLDEMSRR